jgi:glycosyltransferase involved in cell wall biosynthesis
MTHKMPRVSIGLPTYNRPDLLSQVLEGFRQQTFADFELIISDNASPNPEVKLLCDRYTALDTRFRYVRQPANQGAEKNFWYVYDQARAPFFLWASDDDLWPPDFLEKGVAALETNPDASAWFCQVVNINISDDVVRRYPSFSRFQSTPFKFVDLARFLWEPEIMGKANLIYAIFRRQCLRDVIQIFRELPSSWGTDMNLVYGFLCRRRILIDDGLVLSKRVPTDAVDSVLIPRNFIYPWPERKTYFANYRKVAAGTGYVAFTSVILGIRQAYDYWFQGRFQVHLDELMAAMPVKLKRTLRLIRKIAGR